MGSLRLNGTAMGLTIISLSASAAQQSFLVRNQGRDAHAIITCALGALDKDYVGLLSWYCGEYLFGGLAFIIDGDVKRKDTENKRRNDNTEWKAIFIRDVTTIVTLNPEWRKSQLIRRNSRLPRHTYGTVISLLIIAKSSCN